MNILCTICSDLFNQAENIYVTKCGHIFHHHCLAQWIERSKTCPQCRNKVTERCMFRLYPTVSNESNGENAATLQSRLDNAQLELRQQNAKFKEKDDKIAAITANLKKQEEMASKYEKQLVSVDSKLRALREQLMYANVINKETQKLKEDNENLKNNIQTLNGLQKVLNATADEVEQMLQSYSDVRTIATFATALKRALCESESKKNEWRDRLHQTKQHHALEKKAKDDLLNKVKQLEADLQDSEAKIELLKSEVKSGQSKKSQHQHIDVDVQVHTLNREEKLLSSNSSWFKEAILETDNNNCSFDTMVNKIQNSDSPYLNLKQGGLLSLTALQRAPLKIPDNVKPSEQLLLKSIKNAQRNNWIDEKKTTSIFHRKEPMKMDSFESNTHLDISYDGMGGHSKPDQFPVPKKSPVKNCIPKLSAKHKLKRPNPVGSQDIEKMLKRIKEK